MSEGRCGGGSLMSGRSSSSCVGSLISEGRCGGGSLMSGRSSSSFGEIVTGGGRAASSRAASGKSASKAASCARSAAAICLANSEAGGIGGYRKVGCRSTVALVALTFTQVALTQSVSKIRLLVFTVSCFAVNKRAQSSCQNSLQPVFPQDPQGCRPGAVVPIHNENREGLGQNFQDPCV